MHVVDVEKLKKIELGILEWFVKICDKYDLKYYIIGGTLIGAVRHKGFIPWDDDIDIVMFRSEYNKFTKIAQNELPEHLFLQTVDTDPEYLMGFAKIRNCNTAFIETSARNLNINHGVFIDIFPLDFYDFSYTNNKLNKIKSMLINAAIMRHFVYKNPVSLKVRFLQILSLLCYRNVRKAIAEREKMIQSVQSSDFVRNFGGAWGEKEIFPVNWFGEGCKLEFEGMSVTVPSKYHEILTQVYGDYMKLPPVDKRMAHHFCDVIDLEHSYTLYKN